jgi:hypothetical protein
MQHPQPSYLTVIFAIDNTGEALCEFRSLHPFLQQYVTEEMRRHIVCNCSADCGRMYEVVSMEDIQKVLAKIKEDKTSISN